MNRNLKRKLTSDTYKLAYDFSVECKQSGQPNIDTMPHVSHEYQLSQLIVSLHESYEKKFMDLFQMRFAPKDSLNRFLYEQLSLNNGDSVSSSVIKSPGNILTMNTLDKEIRTSFPITSNLKSDSPQWKMIQNLKACIYISDKFNSAEQSSEPLKQLLNNEINYSEFKSARSHLFSLLEKEIDEKINQIKSFLFNEIQSMLAKMEQIVAMPPVVGYEFKVKIEMNRNDEFVHVECRDKKFRLMRFHYEKLKTLFNLNRKRFKSPVEFEERVYCLLSRYQTFFKCNEIINEGYGMQASLPSRVFAELNKTFKVKQEMFASPFNCYFKQYCSAFSDTDVYFGSQGSFFDFEPNDNGSFQCNPPFTEEVIERLADRIDHLLAHSKYALSFFVFIPEWIEPPTAGLVKMEDSKFNRLHFNAVNGQHGYVSGSQHVSNEESLLYAAMHNTRVFVLQNDAGYSMFTPTKEKIEKLKGAMTVF